MDGAPAGSMSAWSPSGWIQTDIFTEWFDHFVHFFKPSADDPVLLIVDGHYSHAKNLDVVDKAREHSVATVSPPSHLDVVDKAREHSVATVSLPSHLDVVDKAREHSVATVSLPSHSTHKMQSLDILVSGGH